MWVILSMFLEVVRFAGEPFFFVFRVIFLVLYFFLHRTSYFTFSFKLLTLDSQSFLHWSYRKLSIYYTEKSVGSQWQWNNFLKKKLNTILGNLLVTKVSNKLLLVLRETLSDTRAFLFFLSALRYHKHVFEVVRFAGVKFFFVFFLVFSGTLFVHYIFFQIFDARVLIFLALKLYTVLNRLHWNIGGLAVTTV